MGVFMRKVQAQPRIRKTNSQVSYRQATQSKSLQTSRGSGWLKKYQINLRFDLGNLYTRVAIGKNLIYIQPTCFLWETATGEVLAVGKQAFKLLGKEPQGTQLVFPIQFGAISDLDHFDRYLSILLTNFRQEKIWNWYNLLSAEIFLPASSTPLDKKLLIRAFARQGINNTKINSKASMLVASLSPLSPPPTSALDTVEVMESNDLSSSKALVIILDIGEQLTEVVIGSFSRVAFSASLEFGGGLLSGVILDYLRKKHYLVIALSQAMNLKKELPNLLELADSSVSQKTGKSSSPLVAVRGVSTQTGLVTTLNIQSQAIAQVILQQLPQLVTKLRQTLSAVPSSQLLSALENGLIITGGGSQLAGLDQYLAKELQINVFKTNQPFACL